MNKLLLLLALVFAAFGSKAQSWVWADHSAGTQSANSFSVATDPWGNVYVTGNSQKMGGLGNTNTFSLGSASITETGPSISGFGYVATRVVKQ